MEMKKTLLDKIKTQTDILNKMRQRLQLRAGSPILSNGVSNKGEY